MSALQPTVGGSWIWILFRMATALRCPPFGHRHRPRPCCGRPGLSHAGAVAMRIQDNLPRLFDLSSMLCPNCLGLMRLISIIEVSRDRDIDEITCRCGECETYRKSRTPAFP